MRTQSYAEAVHNPAITTVRHKYRSGESKSDYEAYCVYRDLDPLRRSLRSAWKCHRSSSTQRPKTRGRPRVAKPATEQPSGQWTALSTRFKWAERAAAYDELKDKAIRAEHLDLVGKQMALRCQATLAEHDRLKQQVWRLEKLLDKLDAQPIQFMSRWQSETVAGKVGSKTKSVVPKFKVRGYAALAREANATARLALVGLPDWRQLTEHGPLSSVDWLWWNTEQERQAGESVRAFRAYAVYRDLGPDRSIRAAYRESQVPFSSDLPEPAGSGYPWASSHWPVWANRWKWVERAKAYDKMVKAACESQIPELADRRLEFEEANQDRLERRAQKIEEILDQMDRGPAITDVEMQTTVTVGNKVVRTKTHIEGLDLGAYAALQKVGRETGKQAIVGVSVPRRPRAPHTWAWFSAA
jgi:hypothetical protein